MKITKFKKTSMSKYKVYFDNNTSILLHEDIILKYNLICNKVVSDNDLNEILKENNNYLVYDIALKYISTKMRCEKEIKEHLIKKNIDEDIINKTINKLKKDGYLDEKSYIRAFIYDKVNISKIGPKKIKRELVDLKLPGNIIDYELSSIDDEIFKVELEKQIQKRIAMSKNYSGNVLKQKIISYFMDKGYDKNMITSILDTKKLYDEDALKKEYNKLYNKYSKKYSGKELEMIIKQKLYQKGFYQN